MNSTNKCADVNWHWKFVVSEGEMGIGGIESPGSEYGWRHRMEALFSNVLEGFRPPASPN